MTTIEREQLVLSLLKQVEPTIRKCTSNWHLDYDDAYQEASIHIMNSLDKEVSLTNVRNLAAVISYRVRLRMIQLSRYTQRREAESLDAPLQAESGITLADLLPSPYSIDPATVVLTRERLQALETSIRHARGSHGVAVRSRYETALATYC
jgi:DNA-directed RNA polymerase specialized sigma24 family protein